MIRLIINADDFGYCSARNRAIVELFRNKSISSSSLLVNGVEAASACRLAETFELPLGLHWNLTEGRPISGRTTTSLVDAQGLMHGKFGLREKLDRDEIRREDLLEELEQQLLKFHELTRGHWPTHVDGHQHIHVHPRVVECVVEVMKKYGIRDVRAPADLMWGRTMGTNSFYDEILLQTESAKQRFDANGIRYPEFFFGLTTMGASMSSTNVEACLRALPSDRAIVVEWMCHPGYPNDGIQGGCGQGSPPDLFSQSADRQLEYNFLSTNEVKEVCRRYNVRLSTDRSNDGAADADANPCESNNRHGTADGPTATDIAHGCGCDVENASDLRDAN